MSGPHDLFARFAFGHPERAAAELRAVLPPEVVAQVDWAGLQREPSSVVDPELREQQSDLLFSARLLSGGPVLLYLLLEHQSSVDRWMALRMLRYVLRQLEHWRQQNPDSLVLPVVIPVVMYHGPETGWTAARRVEELFQLPGEALEQWRALVPRFEYLLDDLTAAREEALRARSGPPLARLAVLLLRSGRSEQLTVLLEGWKPLLAELLASPEGQDPFRAVVHYLFRVVEREARVPLRRVLHSIVREQGEEGQMKTIADELIEEGWQKGWNDGLAEGQARGLAEGQARGLARGRAESLLMVLSDRGIAADDRTRARILDCMDPDLLDRWIWQVKSGKSLKELENF